jgi:hypothetical protein
MAFFNIDGKKPTNMEQAQRALDVLKELAGRNRRMRMQERIDYLYDKQETYLDDLLTDQFQFPDRLKLQKEFYNITSLIINELAVIYNEEPTREIVNGTAKDDELYENIVKDSQINQVMQQVNRFTKLCRTVAVRPVWRNNTIKYDIYTPNIYDVFQDPLQPSNPVAFVWGNVIDLHNEISDNNDDTRGERDPWDEKQNIFYYMDASHFIVFNLKMDRAGTFIPQILQSEGNPDNINPYGVLPFVTVRDGVTIDQYFLEGGDDLVQTNGLINIKLTELNYLTKMQSFSIPVRKGVNDTSGALLLDPSLTIDLPGDDDTGRNSDFKFVSPDAKIDQMSSVINDKIRKLAIRYNISPERFIGSAQKSSAEALQLRAWDQAKITKRDKPFYASFEKELFEMTKVVWNYHNPNNQFSESAELLIDYPEVETPMTVQERDNHNLLMFTNGLLSKKEWLMRENTDIKDEKLAEKILEENKKDQETEMPEIPVVVENDDTETASERS